MVSTSTRQAERRVGAPLGGKTGQILLLLVDTYGGHITVEEARTLKLLPQQKIKVDFRLVVRDGRLDLQHEIV